MYKRKDQRKNYKNSIFEVVNHHDSNYLVIKKNKNITEVLDAEDGSYLGRLSITYRFPQCPGTLVHTIRNNKGKLVSWYFSDGMYYRRILPNSFQVRRDPIEFLVRYSKGMPLERDY